MANWEEDEITFKTIEKYWYGLGHTHIQLALEKTSGGDRL